MFKIISLNNATWSLIPIKKGFFSQSKSLAAYFVRSPLDFRYFEIKHSNGEG